MKRDKKFIKPLGEVFPTCEHKWRETKIEAQGQRVKECVQCYAFDDEKEIPVRRSR